MDQIGPFALPAHPCAKFRIVILATVQFAHMPNNAHGAAGVRFRQPALKKPRHLKRQAQNVDDAATAPAAWAAVNMASSS